MKFSLQRLKISKTPCMEFLTLMTISAFCTYDATLPSFFISKSRFDQEQCFITQNPDGCDNRTLCSSHEITVF